MPNRTSRGPLQPAPSPEGAAVEKFRFGVLLIPQFSMISLLCTTEPLRVANYLCPEAAYGWELLSDSGPIVTASNGMELKATALADAAPHDCLLVCASYTPELFTRESTLGLLRRLDRHGAMLGSLENGSYLLARAGVLRGETVTAHWNSLPTYRALFPEARFVAQVYTVSDRLMSCSGGLSATDMILHVLARRHGRRFAEKVGNQLLAPQSRPPEARQNGSIGIRGDRVSPSVARACQIMESSVGAPPTIAAIAASLGISRRHLDRLFERELAMSAKRFYLAMRLERARRLVRQSSMRLGEVALSCGFESYTAFSASFRKTFAASPRAERRLALRAG
jgi:transcriptional regulator GlxA family with amidase domain